MFASAVIYILIIFFVVLFCEFSRTCKAAGFAKDGSIQAVTQAQSAVEHNPKLSTVIHIRLRNVTAIVQLQHLQDHDHLNGLSQASNLNERIIDKIAAAGTEGGNLLTTFNNENIIVYFAGKVSDCRDMKRRCQEYDATTRRNVAGPTTAHKMALKIADEMQRDTLYGDRILAINALIVEKSAQLSSRHKLTYPRKDLLHNPRLDSFDLCQSLGSYSDHDMKDIESHPEKDASCFTTASPTQTSQTRVTVADQDEVRAVPNDAATYTSTPLRAATASQMHRTPGAPMLSHLSTSFGDGFIVDCSGNFFFCKSGSVGHLSQRINTWLAKRGRSLAQELLCCTVQGHVNACGDGGDDSSDRDGENCVGGTTAPAATSAACQTTTTCNTTYANCSHSVEHPALEQQAITASIEAEVSLCLKVTWSCLTENFDLSALSNNYSVSLTTLCEDHSGYREVIG